MSSPFWKGGATPSVAQIWKGTITTTTNGDTYTVTVTDDTGYSATISYTVANPPDTTTTLVATGFITAWNASTDPLVSTITATQSSGQVILTADNAGTPFYATTGGTGTWSGTGDTTPNVGPNDWNSALNWSTGAVPVNSDTVTIDGRGSSYAILYGLDQSAVTLALLEIYQGAPDVATTSLALAVSATIANLNLPAKQGAGVSSALINLDFGSNAVNCTNWGGNYAGTGGLPGTIIAGSHSSNSLTVLGGLLMGVGLMTVGEACSFPTITLKAGTLLTGSGTTWTTVNNNGGTVTLGTASAAGSNQTLTNTTGTTRILGSVTVGTANADGGTILFNNRTTVVTNLNMNGGTVDFRENQAAATVTSTTIKDNGGTIVMLKPAQVTFTNKWAYSFTTKTKVSFQPA